MQNGARLILFSWIRFAYSKANRRPLFESDQWRFGVRKRKHNKGKITVQIGLLLLGLCNWLALPLYLASSRVQLSARVPALSRRRDLVLSPWMPGPQGCSTGSARWLVRHGGRQSLFPRVFDGPCLSRFPGHAHAPVRASPMCLMVHTPRGLRVTHHGPGAQGCRWVQLRHGGMCCYRELHLGCGP
jgi:hypothetical protein